MRGSWSTAARVNFAAKRASISCSDGIEGVHPPLSGCRFALQYREFGNIGVPLDQCCHWSKSRERALVERPHFRGNRRAVRIDETCLAFLESREMNFRDRRG